MIVPALATLGTWEALWWAVRRHRRASAYARALSRARALGRPLAVIGAPDGGVTGGYGCGDITIDLAPCLCCPNAVQADVCDRLPLPDNSAVIFVSCVLEYVADLDAAMREIDRVSCGERYIAHVEPWTATAYAYPGARRTLPPELLENRELPREIVALRTKRGTFYVDAQIADTLENRSVGLQWRYDLPPGAGMLFVFDQPGIHPFWMKNTLVPLDIAFIDDGGRVVSIAKNAAPLNDTTTYASRDTKSVIELPAGFSDKIGLSPGDRLIRAGERTA